MIKKRKSRQHINLYRDNLKKFFKSSRGHLQTARIYFETIVRSRIELRKFLKGEK